MSNLTRYRVWPDGTAQEADIPAHHWKSDDYELVEAPTPEDAWARAKANAPMVPELNYAALCDAAFLQDKHWTQGTTGCVAFARGAEWYRDQLLAKGLHTLYKTNDPEAPATIRDRNGEVVLPLCKVCGKAEGELSEPCHAPAMPLGYINAGNLQEMRSGSLPYAYLYAAPGEGVEIPVYISNAPAVPQGWAFSVSDDDDGTWLRVKSPGGGEAAFSAVNGGLAHDNRRSIASRVLLELKEALAATPTPAPAPAPSKGAVGFGARALAAELAEAALKDDNDPEGHDISAGLFGPNVSAWLRKVASEYLAPAPAPAVPQGWKLVPIEPTKEMLDAGLKRKAQARWIDGASVLRSRNENLRPAEEIAALQWEAMLATTPAPAPAVPQGWPFGELSDGQIMATVGRMGELVNYLKLGQQWDGICNLVRQIIRERYTPAPAPAQEVGLTDEQADAVSMALRRAWQLGQTYWQQADSDYISQYKKSGEPQRKFEELCDDTISALRAKVVA